MVQRECTHLSKHMFIVLSILIVFDMALTITSFRIMKERHLSICYKAQLQKEIKILYQKFIQDINPNKY